MLEYYKKSRYILGMNARNIDYIKPQNSKRAINVTNNKLLSKQLLKKHSLPILETFSTIKSIEDLKNFDWSSLPKTFVLKPNRGLGGEGILIVYGKKKGRSDSWVKADRKEVSYKDITGHVLNILEGHYSLTDLPDIAFFEERAKLLKLFKPYTFRGIPDIRIIVYNQVPVMAELRLPTKESEGKANLHAGAIGVGIDMGTGTTTTAIQRDRIIEYAPGTRLPLRGIRIPEWKNILKLAVETQQATNVGFLGVDIALDRDKGPLILELNAHPGLSIQNANLSPLQERLKRVKGLEVKNIEKEVQIGQNLFGGEVEEEMEEISGKRVIGINEPIKIFDIEGNKHPTIAKIDTGAYRSTICANLAKKLNIDRISQYKKVRSSIGIEEWPIIDLSFLLDKRRVSTEAFMADRSDMKYDIIIGRKDLKRFLLDPAKNIFMGKKRKKC